MMGSGPAAHLLAIERGRRTGYRSRRLYPAFAAILNLFLCAYFERFLKGDVSGYYFSLFFFLETALYLSLSITNFVSVVQEILSKSRIFPVTSSSRMRLALTSNLLRPVVLSLVGSNLFFLCILLQFDFPGFIFAALLFVLMILCVEVIVSTTLLILHRWSASTTEVVTLLALSMVALLVGTVVFHVEFLLRSIPTIGWATQGILAAKAGATPTVMLNLGWLTIVAIVGLSVGRRFS